MTEPPPWYAGTAARAPAPMTAQDLDDWCASVDAGSAVGGTRRGETPESVIQHGEAVIGVINARRRRA